MPEDRSTHGGFAHHDAEGRRSPVRSVAVLKSQGYDAQLARTGALPYRIDLLADHGYRVTWSDEHLRGALAEGRTGRLVRWTETLLAPWAQVVRSRRERRDADVTLAIFESEGHALAAWRAAVPCGLLRRLPWLRRGDRPLVIVACWLADLARSGSERRRRLYRRLYRGVDRVVVFSENQSATLTSLLGIPPERIEVVRFGVDLDELFAVATADGGRVVAPGRDLGRDWTTLAAAADGTGWEVDVITRPSQLDGIALPPEVHDVGPLDRAAYLRRLADAALVVVPTDVREYPTGQTVLLEAMALGKACVVTATPAMSGYVTDGVTAVLVPPHDTAALHRAIAELLAAPERRAALGAAARRASEQHGGAAAMWRHVGSILDDVVAEHARSGGPQGR